ncbi:MAG: flagellar protein FlgN [Betaproteobacteria bacterium]|nr:flagellar protein FlgN [Betaproteobacteria bacterium]
MPRTASPDAGSAASAAVFVAGLQDEHIALVAFTSLLRTEQDALVQGDADRLAEIATDKAEQLELLTLLGESRSRHLAAQNLNGSAEGMLTWLSRNPGFGAAVKKIWRDLLAQAETARQINHSNGLLIESRLQQNRLKLAVLQTAAACDGVYRPDGQLRPLRSTRSLSQV